MTFFRASAIGLFFGLVSHAAYTSLNIPAGAVINLTVPNSPPFTSIGDNRQGGRIRISALPVSGTDTLISMPNMSLTISSAGVLCGNGRVDTQSGGNSVCSDISGLTFPADLYVRYQRFGATFPTFIGSPGSNLLEAWPLSTGGAELPYYCVTTSHMGSGCPIDVANSTDAHGTFQIFGAATTNYSVGYWKWWSTTVAPGSPPESESTAADLADFRFEASDYTNSAGTSVSMATGSGSPTFIASTALHPYCVVQQKTLRANHPVMITDFSFPLDGGSTLTRLWTQVSGPSTAKITNPTTITPTISGTVFGSYVLQLQLTDGSANQTTCTVKDGFVVTDELNTVAANTPNQAILLGPQIAFGTNPWNSFDDRMLAEANLQLANINSAAYAHMGGTADWNVAKSGTISVTSGSTAVVGTGTHFNSVDGCPGYLFVWYPWSAVPALSGRRKMGVASCADDTHLTLTAPWNNGAYLTSIIGAGPSYSGWSYSFLSTTAYNTLKSNVAPINFYDNVAAFYALYYRSGIDDWLTAARNLADNWWQFEFDSGNDYFYGESRNDFPRNRSLLGITVRALDGRSDMWPGLEQIAAFNYRTNHDWFTSFGQWNQNGWGNYLDQRENGYALLEEAYCALFDPNATNAATCRTYISDAMTNGFTPASAQNFYLLYWGGFFPGGNQYASWTTAGTPAITLTNGSSTGTCSGCSWTSDLFTTTLNDGNSYPQVWWFTNTAGSVPSCSGGDAVAYYPAFVDATHLTLKNLSGAAVNYAGTTGAHGWAVGSSIGAVGCGAQPYMLAITSVALDFAAKAMQCTATGVPANCDNTIAANARTYAAQIAMWLQTTGYASPLKGMYYFGGGINCGIATLDVLHCSSAFTAYQSRDLSAEAIRAIGLAFAQTGSSLFEVFGDTIYNAAWARPGFTTPVGGVDGTYVFDYVDGFGFHMIGSLPTGVAQKYFGTWFGIGAGSAWPAYRQYGLIQKGTAARQHE